MRVCDALLSRVRGEFREMPGMRLSSLQASRFWQLDRETCDTVLARLTEERFLVRTADGVFIALE